jgi:hypothetical protein
VRRWPSRPPRLALACASLAASLASCTLLASRDGLEGPPLTEGADGGDASAPGDARGEDVIADTRPDDGADASSAGPVTLFAGQQGAIGIATSGTSVYWVAGQPRGLLRAPRAGGAITHLDDVNQPVGDAFDLAVDAAYVYWSTRSDGRVQRRPLGGGANEPCFTAGTHAAYIALGAAGVYVTDFQNDVSEAGVGVGSVVLGACGGAPATVFADQPRATGLATLAQLLYWGRNQPDGISFGATSGGTASTFHDVTGAVGGVAVDASALYWIREARRVMRFDFATRQEAELYDAGAPFGDGDVAVDDEAVYWTESANGVVKRIRKP